MNAPLSPAAIPSRDEEMADELFTSVFPNGLPVSAPSAKSAILTGFPLTESHHSQLAQSNAEGVVLGVSAAPLKRISRTHHRLAQFLAAGMDEGQAGVLCNYNPSTVSILKTDPMFLETVAFYESQAEEAFRDVVTEMRDLHQDVVVAIRERLEDRGDTIPLKDLTGLLTALSDRTGNGPSSSTTSKNLTIALSGEDLARIKSTGGAPTLESYGTVTGPSPAAPALGSTRALTPEDRRLVEGYLDPAPRLDADSVGQAGERPSGGTGVREEGSGPAECEVALAPLPPVD